MATERGRISAHLSFGQSSWKDSEKQNVERTCSTVFIATNEVLSLTPPSRSMTLRWRVRDVEMACRRSWKARMTFGETSEREVSPKGLRLPTERRGRVFTAP